MNLLARVIDRGTATRSAGAIAEELDGRGVTLNVGVTRHLVSFTCTCLAADFEAVLALLADVIVCADVSGDRSWRRGRAKSITAIGAGRGQSVRPCRRRADGDALRSGRIPTARRLKGTIESVERITRGDLLSLHAARFAPSELTVVVVGDVEASTAVEAAIARSWDPGRAAAPARACCRVRCRRRHGARIVIPMMNKAQADIAYGFVSIATIRSERSMRTG